VWADDTFAAIFSAFKRWADGSPLPSGSEENSDGSIELLAAKSIERAVQLRGTNDIGRKVEHGG
jgi:hypothetical protein